MALLRGALAVQRNAGGLVRGLPPPPPVLCYSHISGGEHLPNSAVLGKTLCVAWPAAAWEGRQGAEAALVGSGTTVPLSPSKIDFLRLLGVAKQAAHLSQFLLNPPSSPPQPNGWAPNPPIHEWRIPSSKGEHVLTPGSTNRHTCSAFMAPPTPTQTVQWPLSPPQPGLPGHNLSAVECIGTTSAADAAVEDDMKSYGAKKIERESRRKTYNFLPPAFEEVEGRLEWILTEEDVDFIGVGASFLASGGGGSPYHTNIMIRNLLRSNPAAKLRVDPHPHARDAAAGALRDNLLSSCSFCIFVVEPANRI